MGNLILNSITNQYGDWYHLPIESYIDKLYVDTQVNSISGMIKYHGYEKVLDEMDIEQIEQYLRNKKLKRITGNIKNR